MKILFCIQRDVLAPEAANSRMDAMDPSAQMAEVSYTWKHLHTRMKPFLSVCMFTGDPGCTGRCS